MTTQTPLGGTFTMAPDLTVTRMGYEAMQLAGPGVFGPPADRDAAVAVLREALSPYPESLHIVTKVGALRDTEGGWLHARAPEQIRQAVHDNLERLGLSLDVVNMRVGGFERPSRAQSRSSSPHWPSSSRRD